MQYGSAIAARPAADYVGVVDPFLSANVRIGQGFWLILKPGTVTDLRHEWTHPLFPMQEPADPVYEDDGCSGC